MEAELVNAAGKALARWAARQRTVSTASCGVGRLQGRAWPRLAVCTVRCVAWKSSTPSSQGSPQCASSRRLTSACITEAGSEAR